MSSLKFNLKLVGSNSDIAKDMLSALIPDINNYLDKTYQKMSDVIPDILVSSIQSQPEYASLLGGQLQAEFGIPDPQNRLNEIIQTIKNTKILSRTPTAIVGNRIKASIKLQMVKKDFADLLALGSASFTTEKGTNLEWLRWLLLEGDSIIISDYQFVLGPSPHSRTGLGIMKQFGSSGWRVPPEFAGSMSNNWITRAIDLASSQIDQTIQQLVGK